MSDERLDAAVREHYGGQTLSPAALARLQQAIAEEETLAGRWRKRTRHLGAGIAIAASILIAVVAALLLFNPDLQPEGRRTRLEVAREATRDHNLMLEVEFPTGDFADLRSKMRNLGFSPVEPEMVGEMNMRLLGGRYTSLQGQPAVLMKLADARGEVCTLLQARPVEKLSRIGGTSRHQLDGLLVDVWREKGLIMVLTRPIA